VSVDKTRVVNIRDLPRNPAEWPADHVYIGRSMPARGLRSRWGNPFRLDETMSREEAIEAYEEYLREQPRLLARVAALRGKTLVCWCKPEPCHGDVLARLADQS
jgi:hypothetical protein